MIRLASLLATLVAGGIVAPTASASVAVAELPVAFRVANTDTSGVPCPSDGATYTVRGHITGPRAALAGRTAGGIAVYVTGLEVGEWGWRLTDVPGYDWPLELARRGHVSLTIDMLGYGASGHPPGTESCWGSQADVLHQIIAMLRTGRYSTDRAPVAFARVASVGHDVGGAIAQIEAYSYRDVDALAVVSWSDQGFSPLILRRFARAGAVCARGAGYYFIERPAEYRPDLFVDPDPRVFAAAMRQWEPNPCGYESSSSPGITADLARLGEINVPVLLAIGAEDRIWSHAGWALQRTHYTGSADVTAVTIPDTGHLPMLERTAPALRALLDSWLARRLI